MVRGGIGENTETCGKWMTEVCLGVFWMGAFLWLARTCPPCGRVHTGSGVRAVASLGLGFEAGLWNASMISVAPCSGAGA